MLLGKYSGVFGKGGDRKSTVAVLLTGVLRTRGHQVCVVDADSMNVALSRAVGSSQTSKTLIDLLGGMIFIRNHFRSYALATTLKCVNPTFIERTGLLN